MSRPTEGIAVDAAHSMKNGVTQYRGIDLKTGLEIFAKEIGNQTVNIGEFLGVVAAVKFIIDTDYRPRVVYTDSMTALTWLNEKQTASRKRYAELQKAEVFLKAFAFVVDRIEVRHWNNAAWGETPADYGLK